MALAASPCHCATMPDTAPTAENLYSATGWSGHGWAIAPVVTRLLATWVFEQAWPELLRPFSYKRFQSHTP